MVTTADTSGILQLQTASTAALTITAGQLVGIGTASPAAKLDIVGSSDILGLTNTSGSSYESINMTVGTQTARILLTGQSFADANYGTGDLTIQSQTAGKGIRFGTAGNTNQMIIDSSGSVAIGSTSTASATRLTLKGAGTGSNTLLNCQDSGGTALLTLAENGNLSFNSGYGSNATAYGCRAWVNYNGNGPSIRASGNVASVVRTATGTYYVTFTNNMPDVNFCFVGSASISNGNFGLVPGDEISSRTVSRTGNFYTVNTSSVNNSADANNISIAIFR